MAKTVVLDAFCWIKNAHKSISAGGPHRVSSHRSPNLLIGEQGLAAPPLVPKNLTRLGPSGHELRPLGPRSSGPPHFWLLSDVHVLFWQLTWSRGVSGGPAAWPAVRGGQSDVIFNWRGQTFRTLWATADFFWLNKIIKNTIYPVWCRVLTTIRRPWSYLYSIMRVCWPAVFRATCVQERWVDEAEEQSLGTVVDDAQ